MRILLEIRHPAHFHHYRHFTSMMTARGHDVRILAISKDVLVELLEESGFRYFLLGQNKASMFGKVMEQVRLTAVEVWHCLRFDPDVVVCRPSPSIALAAWLSRKQCVLFAEDDYAAIEQAASLAFPLVENIIAPHPTDLGPHAEKKVPYSGYQKLAYLHPDWFVPDPVVVESLRKPGERYFLLRLSKLKAYHDDKISGIDDDLARVIVKMASEHGRVYISSERTLPYDLAPHLLKTRAADIHHVMAFADLLIADSQSMTCEACLLGTPSVRFNDFVGRLNYLDELESKYGLTFGFRTSQRTKFLEKVSELLLVADLRASWQEKRRNMLSEMIDVTKFMVWLVEGYPETAIAIRRDPTLEQRLPTIEAARDKHLI